ncbi:MAG: 5-(carboxyamino)imidazole ribonucleotide mutase [bacterium]
MSKQEKTQAQKSDVAIVMGSDSDWFLLEETTNTLGRFGVACEVRVISAHRTPDVAASYARQAAGRGIKVIIAAAGGAAHLAGVLAAHTTLPVIGVPVTSGLMDGLDSLLSTVQMPAGVPVATVAVGKAGAVNAAILSVQILALSRPDLTRRLGAHKKSLMDKVKAGNDRIQMELNKKRDKE